MLVGQQLLATGADQLDRLHFWVSESSRGNAELDYLLPGHTEPVPVEVKAGKSGSLKSLHVFLQRAGQSTALRFRDGPYADEQHRVKMAGGSLDYRLLSLPLYLAEATWELVGRISA